MSEHLITFIEPASAYQSMIHVNASGSTILGNKNESEALVNTSFKSILHPV